MAQSIGLMCSAIAIFCIGITSGRTVPVEHDHGGLGVNVTYWSGYSYQLDSPLYRTMKIIPSPLVYVSQPMMDICRYYCAKIISIDDWEKSTTSVNNLISAADPSTANETTYKETVEKLQKCKKYYRGDSDWNGNDHSNKPAGKKYWTKVTHATLDAIEDSEQAVLDYGHRFADFFIGAFKKAIKRWEVKESEALKIINLLEKIVGLACVPSGYSSTMDKKLYLAVTSMKIFVRDKKIYAELISLLTNTRKVLEKCINHYHQKYWEREDKAVKMK